ncbi:MAG: hypothetical protein WBF08_07215 [Candidatus Bathyarchaeia archaeon]
MKYPTLFMILTLAIILTSNSLGSILIRETINDDYSEPYVSAQYPYSTYVTHSQYFVTISISGLPSEYSAVVKINGNDAGTVKGGSSKEFEVESTKSHIFQIENQISGKDGVRYICQESTWTLEQTQEPYTPYAYYHYPYSSPYYPPYYDGTTTTTTTTTTDTTDTTTTTTTTTTTDTTTTTTTDTTTSGTTTSGTTTSGTTTSDTTGITSTDTTNTGATTTSSTQPTTTTTSASSTTTGTTTRRTTTSGTTTTETQSSQQETEGAHDSKKYERITNAASMLQIAYRNSNSNEITEKYQQIEYHQDSTAYAGPYYYDDYQYNQYYPSPYYYPYSNYYPYYDYPYNYGYPRSSTLEASHTFTYEPEYLLTVQNPHGTSIEKSGWKQKDTAVTLTTPEKIEESNTERYVFKAWYIDGSENVGSTITLTMNKQYNARAEYETQYYLEVRSEIGRPQGSGWYDEGYSAIITVDPEVPMLGFWGSLGAKYVFDRWSGISSGDMFSATTKVVVENPMTVNAIWRADYSYAYMILAIILAAALLLIVVTVIALTRGITFRRERGSPPLDTLNLRYSQGEISRADYLKMKKDLEKS